MRLRVLNPRVLVEVTSDSTEDYDRGEKLEHYQQIPSLETVVIVSHREPRLDVWSRPRDSATWSRETSIEGQMATLPALGCALDVDAIWAAALEPA
ncbi:MAG: Uma2 family endonuclease [Polyangiaceae bacterium]